jgi:hypothetical protein
MMIGVGKLITSTRTTPASSHLCYYFIHVFFSCPEYATRLLEGDHFAVYSTHYIMPDHLESLFSLVLSDWRYLGNIECGTHRNEEA